MRHNEKSMTQILLLSSAMLRVPWLYAFAYVTRALCILICACASLLQLGQPDNDTGMKVFKALLTFRQGSVRTPVLLYPVRARPHPRPWKYSRRA